MSRGEFNRDMDDYLKRRRVSERTNPLLAAKQFFTRNFKFGTVKKAEPVEQSLDVPQEQIDAMLAGQGVARGATRITMTRPAQESVQQAARPQTQAAKPQERSAMGWFSSKKKEDDDYDMADVAAAPAQPVIDEEVKEVLKITFKWLKMMDPETVEEIKNSPDFEKYKAVLGKYGLIKK